MTSPQYRVVTHHRRNGGILTIRQEEGVLIAAFGLLWFGASPHLLANHAQLLLDRLTLCYSYHSDTAWMACVPAAHDDAW